jgi:hypothetical protein
MSDMEPAGTTISLRHTLAALAYRANRALENAPPEFAGFEAGPNPRTPERVLAHMGDLMEWAISLVEGNQRWHDSEPLPWPDEVARFFGALEAFDRAVTTADIETGIANGLFQGPIADALTHTGQLAMLRRMAGCPIRGENYFVADISVGQTAADQPPPRKTF